MSEFELCQRILECGEPVFLSHDQHELDRIARQNARDQQFNLIWDALGMPDDDIEESHEDESTKKRKLDDNEPENFKKQKVVETEESASFGTRVIESYSSIDTIKRNGSEITAPRSRIQQIVGDVHGDGPYYLTFRMLGFDSAIKGILPCEERRLFEYEITAIPDNLDDVPKSGSRFTRPDKKKPAKKRYKNKGSMQADLKVKAWKVFPVAPINSVRHEIWEIMFTRFMAHNVGSIRQDELKKAREVSMRRLDQYEEDRKKPFSFRKWLISETKGTISQMDAWPRFAAEIANGKSNLDYLVACEMPELLRFFTMEQLLPLPWPQLVGIYECAKNDFVSLFFHHGDGGTFSSSWPQITLANLMRLHNDNIGEVADIFRSNHVTDEEFCAIWWYHCIQVNQEQLGHTYTPVQCAEKEKVVSKLMADVQRKRVFQKYTVELELDSFFPKDANKSLCTFFGNVYRNLFLEPFSTITFHSPPNPDKSMTWLLAHQRLFIFQNDRLVLDRFWNDTEYTLRALRDWNGRLAESLDARRLIWKTTDEFISWSKINGGVCDLSDEQKSVLMSISENPVTVLTGPPGSGKSYIEQFITGRDLSSRQQREKIKAEQRKKAQELKKQGVAPPPPTVEPQEDLNLPTVLFMAPTNRLVAGQNRKLKRPVMTLDSFCAMHRNGPLEKFACVRFIIIDEATMCPAALLGDAFRVAIRLLPMLERIFILGDLRQLPSISPGATFRDLIYWSDSNFLPEWAGPKYKMPINLFGIGPVCRLTMNHRASSESRILVDAMEAVAEGDPERFMLLRTPGILELDWINDPDDDFKGTWDEIATEAVGSTNQGYDIKTLVHTQIICFRHVSRVRANLWCMYKSGYITYDEMAQEILPREVFVGEKITFTGKIGDQDVFKNRVVVVLRMYVDASATGDKSVLTDVKRSSELKSVRTQQDRWYMDVEDVDSPGVVYNEMRCTQRVLNLVQPGYAVTTHSMEGGECNHVIFILEPWVDNQVFLTALSRARKSVKIRLDPELVQHISIQLRLNQDETVTGKTCIEYVTRYRKPTRQTIFGDVLAARGLDFVRSSPTSNL